MTFSIMTLSITIKIATFSIMARNTILLSIYTECYLCCVLQLSQLCWVITLSVVMLNVVMLIVVAPSQFPRRLSNDMTFKNSMLKIPL
jgi:hypothetical protein